MFSVTPPHILLVTLLHFQSINDLLFFLHQTLQLQLSHHFTPPCYCIFGPLIDLLSFFSHCTLQFILLPQSYHFHSTILSVYL